ncbi:TetR/AcrR family transcriptional regulator [Streptomyces sp. NBC_00878]|uniref:TetR/AcrR family transcriptional regulator n=1 Tax=Streptomyces sp. NBC_00878 TaxID=2975854 RepID=UPI0022585E00|nr:TetR/AcrR family transcriptional regulator [Streptomyces sp. NBC_00878]MCX4908820.1 TetR/AcrR family transcriptional regulator [Streptomyces sp. NBC_00878]
METGATTTGAARGGRGARERILRAAGELFYTRGIHATGVAALIEAAHVSPRTFYVHFPTKNALVEEYLRRFEGETPLFAETELERTDLPPVQRLLAVFAPIDGGPGAVIRGCPFHNAVVEGAGALPEIAQLAQRHKRAFRDRLVATAAEAGAADPEALGRQLAVLFEGANALAASCDDAEAFTDARHAAEALLDLALARQGGRRGAVPSE